MPNIMLKNEKDGFMDYQTLTKKGVVAMNAVMHSIKE